MTKCTTCILKLLDRGKDGGSFLCVDLKIDTGPVWILRSASIPPRLMTWLDSVSCIVNLFQIWHEYNFIWFNFLYERTLLSPTKLFQTIDQFKEEGTTFFKFKYSNGATHSLLQSLASYTCSEDTIKTEQCFQSASSPGLYYNFFYIYKVVIENCPVYNSNVAINVPFLITELYLFQCLAFEYCIHKKRK